MLNPIIEKTDHLGLNFLQKVREGQGLQSNSGVGLRHRAPIGTQTL
jgi:hypothetical protein